MILWAPGRKSGFRQYFHPRTGRGHGTRSFSCWAALLIHVLVAPEAGILATPEAVS